MVTTPQRPDYDRIAQLERELGIGDHAEERGICPDPVCLIKDCDAETVEIHLWSGPLIRRMHKH